MLHKEQEILFNRASVITARQQRAISRDDVATATRNLNKLVELQRLILALDLWDEYESYQGAAIIDQVIATGAEA